MILFLFFLYKKDSLRIHFFLPVHLKIFLRSVREFELGNKFFLYQKRRMYLIALIFNKERDFTNQILCINLLKIIFEKSKMNV